MYDDPNTIILRRLRPRIEKLFGRDIGLELISCVVEEMVVRLEQRAEEERCSNVGTASSNSQTNTRQLGTWTNAEGTTSFPTCDPLGHMAEEMGSKWVQLSSGRFILVPNDGIDLPDPRPWTIEEVGTDEGLD